MRIMICLKHENHGVPNDKLTVNEHGQPINHIHRNTKKYDSIR